MIGSKGLDEGLDLWQFWSDIPCTSVNAVSILFECKNTETLCMCVVCA